MNPAEITTPLAQVALRRQAYKTMNKLQKLRHLVDAKTEAYGRIPTRAELAQEMGTTEEEVSQLLLATAEDAGDNPIQLRADEVILSIFHAAKSGNATSQRLWMQLMDLWSARREARKAAMMTPESTAKHTDLKLEVIFPTEDHEQQVA